MLGPGGYPPGNFQFFGENAMSELKLKDQVFEDLYISQSFNEIKGLRGAESLRVAAPDGLRTDINNLYVRCMEQAQRKKKDEFSISYDDVFYRITVYKDLMEENVFVCRRSAAEIRELNKIVLPAYISSALMARELKGLILVAGEMGSGKTTTAVSVIVERLKRFGGLAIAVEDPPETRLNGSHGQNGRCIQIEADRNNGGYAEPLIKALRSGAEMILIGEIRDAETAVEVIKASINGHLIISTIHSGSITQAISRLAAMSKMVSDDVNANISEGLSLVLYQRRIPFPVAGGMSSKVMIQGLDLSFSENSNDAKTKIREGKFQMLEGVISQQIKKEAWSGNRLE